MNSLICIDDDTIASLSLNNQDHTEVSLLGLTKNQDLYMINGYRDRNGVSYSKQIKLAYNVTSFMLHKMEDISEDSKNLVRNSGLGFNTTQGGGKSIRYSSNVEMFILATLNSHELIIIPLTENLYSNILSNNARPERSTYRRKIASGATLHVSFDVEVILHIPRGEIESIRPRPLLISKLRKYLAALNFEKAFNLVRTNRLDMNLLIDDDYNRFVENIKLFIDQVGYQNTKDGFHIFIAEVNDNDCRESENYKKIYDAYKDSKSSNVSSNGISYVPIPTSNKKNIICDLFKTITTNLSVFTSCCIRKNPREIKESLLKIKDELDSNDPQRMNLAENAIKQIFTIVDDKHKLYLEALGTYDKNIFQIIAKRAHQDPTEVQELQSKLDSCSPDAFRRANIDIYLKRFHSALDNLAKSGHQIALNEGIRISRNENLFAHFISCFESTTNESNDFYVQACLAYAVDLEKKGKYRGAELNGTVLKPVF